MKRTEKEEMVGMLAGIFKGSQVGLLVDFRGLSVSEVTDLRRQLHEHQATMRVLKNRMAKIAIKGTPFEPLAEKLTEPRAFIFADDPVTSAKVVSKFMGGNNHLQYISGVLVTGGTGEVLDEGRLKALGNLPSREELLVKLLFLMNANQSLLVRTLNEIPAKFVRTLAAIAQSKES